MLYSGLKEKFFFYIILSYSIFSVFFFFFVFFHFFVFFVFSGCFSCFTSIRKQRVSIEPKQTEDPPKQFKREYIWGFLQKIYDCFGLLRNRSVCFGCFYLGSKHRNKPNIFLFGFTKQTETNAKQILFRFVSVRTEIYFCLFRGHPTREYSSWLGNGTVIGQCSSPCWVIDCRAKRI